MANWQKTILKMIFLLLPLWRSCTDQRCGGKTDHSVKRNWWDGSGTINDEKRGPDFSDAFFHNLAIHYNIPT